VKNRLLDQFDLPDLEPVSGMDSTFLYAETERSPMHIGAMGILEGDLDFASFKKIVASRLHQMPKLRKRLVQVPFSIDHPYWVEDPHFNLDLHLHHVALPKPGDWKALRRLASQIFSEPLDKSRPLWSFTFVEGLDQLSQVKPGSVAIISKIHHVAIDGVGGAALMAILFDFGPDKSEIPEPRPWTAAPLPNEVALMLKSTLSFAQMPLKLPKLVKETVSSTVKAGFMTRAQHLDLPTAPFTAPKTPINGIISAQRKWNTSIISLDRVKKLKSVMGTTLNDVILAICSGALRRYLDEKKKLPKKPLVAMVPISTKASSAKQSGSNQLSAMLVQLATDVEDRLDRLEAIYENTLKGKTYQDAVGAKTLANIAEAVPFGIASQAARLYSRYNLSRMHNPVFNVVITNVPGPQMPIYMHGSKLHSVMGMAPIIDGMGLIITVLSYNGNITISPTSDARSMPDLNIFSKYILEEANALEEEVLAFAKKGKKKKPVKATAKPKKSDTTKQVDSYFEQMRDYLKENPDYIKKPVGHFQFFIKGEEEYAWQLNLRKPPGSVRKGAIKNYDVSLTIKEQHLLKIAQGKLDVGTAFLQGRLKLDGDLDLAMKLAAVLKNMK